MALDIGSPDVVRLKIMREGHKIQRSSFFIGKGGLEPIQASLAGVPTK